VSLWQRTSWYASVSVRILRGSATLRTVFSRRSARERTPNALARLLSECDAPRWDLTSSNPTRAGIAYPDELLFALERAQARSLVYRPEPFGSQQARAALAAQTNVAVEDILLTASTSEAYAFLFKLLCDPGDAILVPSPSYPLFEHLAELEGVEVRPYRLAYDGSWFVDLDSVKRAVTSRVRGIVVVSPNNPTGQYLTRSEQAALAELRLPIISDEVFAAYPLDSEASALPPHPECLTFTLDGLSKRAGSPQLKLGWTLLSGPTPARREARERLELVADTFLSVSTPIQSALPDLLQICPQVTQAIGQRCRGNLATLDAAIRDSALTRLRAEGGWCAVLRLPSIFSEDDWVVGLARDAGVLVQPGWFYDLESEPHIVLSLLPEPRAFEAGIARLVAHVAATTAT
jgi:alanine-synthesizing transaminase